MSRGIFCSRIIQLLIRIMIKIDNYSIIIFYDCIFCSIYEVNLLKIENGWNIAGEDIAEEERTEGKDSATNKI